MKAGAGAHSLTVFSTAAWQAEAESWITVDPEADDSKGIFAVRLNYKENTTGAERSGARGLPREHLYRSLHPHPSEITGRPRAGPTTGFSASFPTTGRCPKTSGTASRVGCWHTGSVRVSVPRQGRTLLLRPDEKLSFDRYSKVLRVERVEAGNYCRWFEPRLIFDNMPLRDVVTNLERRYNVEISLSAHIALDKRLSMVVCRELLEDILEVISSLIPSTIVSTPIKCISSRNNALQIPFHHRRLPEKEASVYLSRQHTNHREQSAATCSSR